MRCDLWEKREDEGERERESKDILKNHVCFCSLILKPDLVYIVIQIIHFVSERREIGERERERERERYSEIFNSYAYIFISYHNCST